MLKIKKFTETDFEFSEICRIFNLVSHDFQEHPDDVKDDWELKDKSLIFDRLFLQEDGKNLGFLAYNQGRKPNNQICFFNLYLDPNHEGKGCRQLLFNQMLEEVKAFDCNQFFADIYDHPNYDGNKAFLERNDFSIGLKIREYSLKLKNVDFSVYDSLLKRLDDKMDLTDAIIDRLPSIVAQNMMQGAKAQAQGRGGQPPEAQGRQGGNNAPQPAQQGGGKPPGIGMNV